MKSAITIALLAITQFAFAQPEYQLIALGEDALSEDKTELALKYFKQAFTQNPKSVKAIGNIAIIYCDQSKYQEAYKLVNDGLLITPNNENLLITKANAANGLRQYDEALAIINKLLITDPNFYLFYYIRGISYAGLGEKEIALGQYSKSIFLEPRFIGAYIKRASELMEMGIFEEAIQDYNIIVGVDKSSFEGYANRGFCFYKTGNYDKALADFDSANSLKPFDKTILCNRGNVLLEKQFPDSAQACFEKSLAIDSAYAAPMVGLANVYTAKNDYAQSVILANKAIASNPSDINAYVVYGKALLGLGKNEEAIRVSNKISGMENGNREGLCLKTRALKHMKKYGEAIETISAGISKYPGDAGMYLLRASLYSETGHKSKASADLEKAKKINSKKH